MYIDKVIGASSNVLCDKKMLIRLKGRYYKVIMSNIVCIGMLSNKQKSGTKDE